MTSVPPRLEIVGAGAVSPAGCSVEALGTGVPPATATEALLSDPGHRVPVRRVDRTAPVLARWEQEPRLRRASPLAHFLMEAADQAMAGAGDLPRKRIGLVCALGTGSIFYSRSFYAHILKKGRHFASPSLFPETVYNSPVSHVASILGIEGACYTLVGDETAWVDALRVAQVWLARGTADAVLVLGGEELDPIVLEAFQRAGWFRRGLVRSEGAAAVLVRAASAKADVTVEVARVSVSFRSRAEQAAAWQKMDLHPSLPLLLPANLPPSSPVDRTPRFAQAARLGPDWGSAFTASAGWSFLQAARHRLSAPPFSLLVPGANAAVTAVSFP
jgi:3-oxoacyl-(acyl-carrier-protein) synthase